MRNILTSLFFLLCIQLSHAQQPSYSWSMQIGGTNYDYGTSLTSDSDGNIYATGAFADTVDFDPGPSVFNLNSVNSYDIFICKFNKFGNFIWAKNIGSIYNDQGISITIDHSGNIYTTGIFMSTVDFDPGPNIFNLTSVTYNDVFVCKLDSSGNFIWARSFSGPNSIDYSWSISVDKQNNVYTTGNFTNTVDFDPGPNVSNLTSNGSSDIFVSKLDSNGIFKWSKSIGGTGIDDSKDINVDINGNVYITGNFDDSVDFDPGIGFNFISTPAAATYFILKLDSSGNFVWTHTLSGASGSSGGISIALDSSCNVYTCGNLNGIEDFDPGIGIYILSGMSFIYKLDSLGNFIFAKSFNGGTQYAITLDNDNNIYTTGYFNSTTDFDPGPNVYDLIATAGSRDIFICKLDSMGEFSWALNEIGMSDETGRNIVVDQIGNIFCTGIFAQTVDFNPGLGVDNKTSNGFFDAFILKLKQCYPTNNTITESVCNSFFFNGQTITSSGIYSDTLINSEGCDSIVNLNLTVLHTSTNSINASSCSSYNFNGQTYTSSGTYFDTLTNSVGCDSIITLNVSINTSQTILNQTSCNSFLFNGQLYNSSGTYTDSLVNAFSCDSIVTLNLNILHTDFDTISHIDCDSYSFNGLTYTTSGIYYDTLINSGGCDSIVTLLLTITNLSSTATINESVCNSYNFNGQILTSSGIYYDTLLNSAGCDSMITLNLNLTTFDTTVSQLGFSMWSNTPANSSTSYQWIDCKNNSFISGATNQGFTTTAGGSYAVIVNYMGCVDTSECHSIFALNTNHSIQDNAIKVYPNPSHGLYTLVSSKPLQNSYLKVFDITGNIIYSKNHLSSDKITFDISSEANGCYLLELIDDKNVFRIKILKEVNTK